MSETSLKDLALRGADSLTRNEKILSHRLDSGSSSSPSKASSSGGSRKFDEKKVKRDGKGRFSRQEVIDNADALWLMSLKDIESIIINASAKEIQAITAQIAIQRGIKYSEVEKKAWGEASKRILGVLNDKAKELGVSPSGTQRIQFGAASNKSLTMRQVPYRGPNPHAGATKRVMSQTRSTLRARARKTDNGPMFNPDAKLDPSQIQWRRPPSFRHDELDGKVVEAGKSAIEKALQHD